MRTHAAASALVVKDERLLLIRQRRGDETWWEIPGGYLDDGECLQECAARETSEETGVEVVVHDIAFTLLWRSRTASRSNVIVVFEATPTATPWVLQPQEAENIDAAEFFEFSDIPIQDVHPLYREPLHRWLTSPPKGGPPALHYCERDVDVQGRATYLFS